MVRLFLKAKLVVALSIALSISLITIKHQLREINIQKESIKDLLSIKMSQKKTINRMKYNRLKANKAFKEYNKRQHNINMYFEELKERIGENDEKNEWDENKVPDSVICLINCMHRKDRGDSCKCP